MEPNVIKPPIFTSWKLKRQISILTLHIKSSQLLMDNPVNYNIFKCYELISNSLNETGSKDLIQFVYNVKIFNNVRLILFTETDHKTLINFRHNQSNI